MASISRTIPAPASSVASAKLRLTCTNSLRANLSLRALFKLLRKRPRLFRWLICLKQHRLQCTKRAVLVLERRLQYKVIQVHALVCFTRLPSSYETCRRGSRFMENETWFHFRYWYEFFTIKVIGCFVLIPTISRKLSILNTVIIVITKNYWLIWDSWNIQWYIRLKWTTPTRR